jgi:hypothetical protein
MAVKGIAVAAAYDHQKITMNPLAVHLTAPPPEEEGTMNSIRRILAVVATLAGAVLVIVTITAAHAALPPHGGAPAGTHAPVRVIVTGGMSGWQIMLIAVGAALVAATVAVLVDRGWTSRKAHTTTA